MADPRSAYGLPPTGVPTYWNPRGAPNAIGGAEGAAAEARLRAMELDAARYGPLSRLGPVMPPAQGGVGGLTPQQALAAALRAPALGGY